LVCSATPSLAIALKIDPLKLRSLRGSRISIFSRIKQAIDESNVPPHKHGRLVAPVLSRRILVAKVHLEAVTATLFQIIWCFRA
jgi:hypothetical protein